MSQNGVPLVDYLTRKYGPNGARFISPNSYLNKSGREVGIDFKSDRHIYPTQMAHSLMEYVKNEMKDNKKANEIMEEMYKRYFEMGENINDETVLRDAVNSVGGIEGDHFDGAIRSMKDEKFHSLVTQKDRNNKDQLRVSGVPFYIIKSHVKGRRPIAFSGAQPPDIIAEQLEEASEE